MTSRGIPAMLDELHALSLTKSLADANEAATRLALVNRILVECLGWPALDLDPERYEPGGGAGEKQWLDYCATVGDARCVIEVKRAGQTFQFTPKRRRRQYKLSTLRSTHGAELRDAISQTLRYCGVAQTPFFVVTNGIQWILGISQWPGAKREELEAVVYHDLTDLRENLEEFVSYVSPQGIASYALLSQVMSFTETLPPFARKLNEDILHNPVSQKSYLSGPLGAVMERYFKNLNVGDDDFADRCYIASELTDGYVQRLSIFAGNTKPDSLRDAQKLDRAKFAKEAPSGNAAQLLQTVIEFPSADYL